MRARMGDIKPGDRVRISYKGLEGWQTVHMSHSRYVEPLGIYIETRDLHGDHCSANTDIEILEHKPAPVVIEVELPAPERWQFNDVWTDRHCGGIGVNAPDTFLMADKAEEYALAILALVHEARR